ncbi:MAG: class I SAM-dependent methyltransferase [Chloroflexota bacterium]
MIESQAMDRTREAYDLAEEYVSYADGDIEKNLFSFKDSGNPWCHHDVTTWNYIVDKLSQENVSRIVDVGCGSGAWSLRIASAFPHVQVTGIDFSPEQISRAQKLLERYNYLEDRVEFTVGDATDLDFGKGEFDVSICLHDVLNHIPSYRVALNEMAKVTSKFNITSVHGFYASKTCFFIEKEKIASYERNGDMVHLIDKDGGSYDVYFHLFKASELAREFDYYFEGADATGVSLQGKLCCERNSIDSAEHIIIYSQARNGA